MPRVSWSGPSPGTKLRAALAAEGLEIGAEPDAILIVATRPRAAAPNPPPRAPWLWLARGAVSPEDAALAIDRGAYDVVDGDAPDAAARLAARARELASPEAPMPDMSRFVAESEAARAVLRQLARAARTSMPVLLTGETGTGKEVAARLVHEWSDRRARRFIPINCAAIPNELLEAELFGYAKGAFTGSVRAYEGQLAAAEGGTVFLDEVDDTPLPFQVKLLRVLEDRVVTRVGENTSQVVDFRILAATNRDLGPLCAAGAFGSDLYERLAIVSVRLPPLRERLADLPALALHMIARFYKEEPAAKARHDVGAVSDAALAALRAYPWPGNIRELRNVIFEALVDKRAGDELLLGDLPRRVRRPPASRAERDADVVDAAAIRRAVDENRFDLGRAREALERAAVEAALARAGNAAAAAGLLGRVGRGAAADPGGTVRAMMRRLGVAPEDRAPAATPPTSSSRSKTKRRRSR
ncbi:MAG TPA: sigma 54-interacting transcriptional regulator [Polyangia bacterium]|nr:sigma 54-interacting transcriptional regulator [Polyangia bacterium]